MVMAVDALLVVVVVCMGGCVVDVMVVSNATPPDTALFALLDAVDVLLGDDEAGTGVATGSAPTAAARAVAAVDDTAGSCFTWPPSRVASTPRTPPPDEAN